MSLNQRRRRATAAELAQGEKEVKQAQERLERELKESGELALEDDQGSEVKGKRIGKKGQKEASESHPSQGTPSTAAAPTTVTSASKVTNSVAGRTPEVRGPPMPLSSTPSTKEKVAKGREDVTSITPYKAEEEVEVGKGGEEEESKEEGFQVDVLPNGTHEILSIATPPEAVKPLFDREQLQGLHEMYSQAPLLYPQFQTPQTSLHRPGFLADEEEKKEVARKARQERMMEEERQEWEAAERYEKEEMNRRIRLLSQENQRLRDQATGIYPLTRTRLESDEVQKRQISQLFEENRLLKVHLQRLLTAQQEVKEDEAVFATPNGSAEAGDSTRPPEAERGEEELKTEQTKEEEQRTGKGGTVPRKKKKEEPVESMDTQHQTLTVVLKLVEGMQELQKKVLRSQRDEDGAEAELVRNAVELPKLPEWSPESSPIDYADWLLLLQPIMADLSTTSETWWEEVVRVARSWYEDHMAKTPLERLGHKVHPSSVLNQKKWSRLEKRASGLLLTAIPNSLREEVVASKSISTLGILVRGMELYQPGGLAERQAILSALEAPSEAQSVGSCIATLRKWIRWKRRAEELGVSVPDPTILARGLSCMLRKILTLNQDLNFRLQLARSSLMIDSVPNHASITQYAEHVMAELEQVNLQSRKKDPPALPDPTKLKRFEEVNKEKKEGRDRKDVEERESNKEKGKCRFYLTDSGCRRGKSCGYSHDLKDERRRCWNCGSIDHMAPACTRPKEVRDFSSKPKIAKAEKEKVEGGKGEVDQNDGAPSIKELIKEANDMLKSMHSSPSSSQASSPVSALPQEQERKEVMEKLQQQLNTLRMKTFRLKRLQKGEKEGLLDSGATHPLRPLKEGEDQEHYKKVHVSLADGSTATLAISPGGAMISEDFDIEPIIPMGLLADQLNCSISWSKGRLEVEHPTWGKLPVEDRHGCPQLPRRLALQLIDELEKAKLGMNYEEDDDFEAELKWMRDLVQQHPVLSRLPDYVKDSLVVSPAPWSSLPANRRMRRSMKRNGFVCHLYAGEADGFTLGRAWSQAGGKDAELLEIDLKRGKEHNMLTPDGPYGGLMRAVLEDRLLGLVGGPNCRTRSVLRHYPVEGEMPPRPIRRWGGEENGIKEATEEEKRKIQEDDILLWRMVFLQMVSTYMRRARGISKEPAFALEQPASPKAYKPEVVSFWDTEEWKMLQKEFQWNETTFHQKPLGGQTAKPTTFAGTMKLNPEEHYMKGEKRSTVKGSWELARWAPGIMHMLSRSLLLHAFGRSPQLKAMSWEEHIMFGHTPARRDCLVCQQNQQSSPHRKVKKPLAGVLSLDTAGPLIPAYNQGGHMARYFLVGTFTWAVPKGRKIEEPPEDQQLDKEAEFVAIEPGEDEDQGHPEDQQDEEEEDQQVEDHDESQKEESNEEEEEPKYVSGGLSDAEEREGREVDLYQEEEAAEEPQDYDIEVFRLAEPMHTKKAKEVTRTTMEMILRLKIDGYTVNKIHTDQGREFSGQFLDWTRRRGIIVTKTAGDEPQSNGRAEAAVKALKNMVRKALYQAGETAKWWPWALKHCDEVLRCKRTYQKPSFPPFMQEVLVRRRRWKLGEFSPTMESVRYLAPSPQNHGHWIVKEGEAPRLTRSVVRKVSSAPEEGHWIALEKELLDGLSLRRRLREKTCVKRIEGRKEDEERKTEERRRLKMVIAEEMKRVYGDHPQMAVETIRIVEKLRKMSEALEDEEEEVLQTKIVSQKEVLAEWEKWIEPATNEIDSLIPEKRALRPQEEGEVQKKIEEAKKKGVVIELIPSKLVYTKKPGRRGGKRKVRWVVCGNFESRTAEEETYSAGADATAFRVACWLSAQHQWSGYVVDVKTAFLNAAMNSTEDTQLLLVAPPPILVEKGLLKRGVMYIPERAIYGLRRSPRLWGEHRDHILADLEIAMKENEEEKEVLILEPLASEPNLWRVLSRGSDQLRGLLMTYVDDIFIAGSPEVSKAILQKIMSTWTTSPPEEITEEGVKFLGMEVKKKKSEEGLDVWHLSQRSYLADLLAAEDPQMKPRKVPITKDQAMMPKDTGTTSPNDVRLAQKIVGEMLWVVTRTRPDIMFSVSRMASSILSGTKAVQEAGAQTKAYLKATQDQGICYAKEKEDEVMINVYTDASFAPYGDESHGCTVVMAGKSPLFWRAGKQSTVSLSTAEAELNEVIEGMIAGESVGVILEELTGPLPHLAWTDSQSGLAILVNEGGSWRTRHLRTRASYARQAIQEGSWGIHHLPGDVMVADTGTKALAASRLEDLKKRMNVRSIEDEKESGKEVEELKKEEKKEEGQEKEEGLQNKHKAATVLRLLTLAATISIAEGQGGVDGEEESDVHLGWMVFLYTLIVVMLTSMVWYLKEGVAGRNRQSRSDVGREQRSPPRTPDRRTKMKAAKKKDDEESEEEVVRPTYLPTPTQSPLPPSPYPTPSSVPLTPRDQQVPLTPVLIWGRPYVPQQLIPMESLSQQMTQKEKEEEEEKRKKKEEDEKRQQKEKEEEEEKQRKKEKEERDSKEAASSASTMPPAAQAGGSRSRKGKQEEEEEVVLTTRFGKVHHRTRECDYLKAPRTGEARQSPWCGLCKANRGTPTNVTLWCSSWGASVHSSRSCANLGITDLLRFTPCSRCRTQNE